MSTLSAPGATGSITDLRPATDLNAVRDSIISRQNSDAGTLTVTDPKNQVFATSSGEIVLGGQFDPSRAAEVAGDTFYAIDLNELQRAILAQQTGGSEAQADPKNHVQVDNRGEVILGGQADPTRSASVQGDTFYWRDLAAEARTVANKMPANTRKVSDGRVEGYMYDIRNNFADTYTLFIYYSEEHSVYRVALVEPRLGGSVDVHGGHLWPDGTLCLTKQNGSGYPSMEDSYAKSVLWTLGMSLVQRGHAFQFNVDQNG